MLWFNALDFCELVLTCHCFARMMRVSSQFCIYCSFMLWVVIVSMNALVLFMLGGLGSNV